MDIRESVDPTEEVKGMTFYHGTSNPEAGKVLVKRMTPNQKTSLIVNHGAHIANFGDVEPDEAWKIDKRKRHLLKRDGSNFFDHAEKVFPKEGTSFKDLL